VLANTVIDQLGWPRRHFSEPLAELVALLRTV
jgi:hypothetical protein